MDVLCNIAGDDILRSIERMKEQIRRAHIFVLSGGFSAGDEPDGSAKFIVNVLNNKDIREEIHALLDRGGLILGICNGFQALVKSGLLPYGRLGMVTKESPTLLPQRHQPPYFADRLDARLDAQLPVARGLWPGRHPLDRCQPRRRQVRRERRTCPGAVRQRAGGLPVCRLRRAAEAEAPFNPNGSSYAIEGIISQNGQILGKMGHTERYEKNLFKNIAGNKEQNLFRNAVDYFRKK